MIARPLALAAMFLSLATGVCEAGVPEREKICDYDPRGFEPDQTAPGRYYGNVTRSCADVSGDWVQGGNTSNPSGRVKVYDVVAGDYYVTPGCERGRGRKAVIALPRVDVMVWVYERYLRCP